jgi:hypothetical protein
MSVINITLDRINGTALQWFTARTDEPRAAIVADILVNEELSVGRLREFDPLAAAAAGVVVGYERLQHERPDMHALVQGSSLRAETVRRTVDRLLSAVGPTVDAARKRDLRLELDACEAVLQARMGDDRPALSARRRQHLPARFEQLLSNGITTGPSVEELSAHVDRRYEDLFSLVLGPDLYQRTAPDCLPEREVRATMYGPSLGPGLGLPE